VTKDLLDLASRMRENLAELDQVVERVEEGWRRAQQSSDLPALVMAIRAREAVRRRRGQIPSPEL